MKKTAMFVLIAVFTIAAGAADAAGAAGALSAQDNFEIQQLYAKYNVAIDSGDAAPTAAQSAALSQLSRDYSTVIERWNKLKSELKAAKIELATKPSYADDPDDSDVA